MSCPYKQSARQPVTTNGFTALSNNWTRTWQFVRFATEPEQLKQLYEKAGRIPARRSLVPEELRDIVLNAKPRPRIPEYAEVSDILQRWLSAALAGDASSEEALRNAARETRAILNGRAR